jgi:hypothetical protein
MSKPMRAAMLSLILAAPLCHAGDGIHIERGAVIDHHVTAKSIEVAAAIIRAGSLGGGGYACNAVSSVKIVNSYPFPTMMLGCNHERFVFVLHDCLRDSSGSIMSCTTLAKVIYRREEDYAAAN